MVKVLGKMQVDDLRLMAEALKAGRLCAPLTPLSLGRYCSGCPIDDLAAQLQQLLDEGMSSAHLAVLLQEVADLQSIQPRVEDLIDLVWTGPDTPGAASRDTSVVVRELFCSANESVIVAGFVVYDGREVFKALADRMEQLPSLNVRMFLNVPRGYGDSTCETELIKEFARRFKAQEWSGARLPAVYYDPRALELDSGKRACLHAKCILVDGSVAYVSSANFTEAAQERNIEAGVLIRSKHFANQLGGHFDALVKAGMLRRLYEI